MAIIDNVKEVARLAQEVGKLDLYKQAVELMAQVTDLAAENFELRQQVAELRQQLDVKSQAKYVTETHTVLLNEKHFCANCYDAAGTLRHLQTNGFVSGDGLPRVQWRCNHCNWVSDPFKMDEVLNVTAAYAQPPSQLGNQ